MKKLFISILVLLPALTMQAQTADTAATAGESTKGFGGGQEGS